MRRRERIGAAAPHRHARLRRLARRGAGAFFAMCIAGALVAVAARADEVADGDRAFAAGRLDEALRHYQQAAKSGSPIGQAGVGRVWLRRGRYELAMEAFQQAVHMDSECAPGYYGMGEVLKRQGKCPDAIPNFERATRINRRYPEAQLDLGNCLVAAGRFEDGLAALNKGLEWGPTWQPRFLVARASAWLSRDSLRAAGIDFTRARELAPNDPTIRRAVGEFYMQRGTWALAVPELQAAVALDSTDADAQYSLAQALFFDQRYDEALQTYRNLIARDPDYAPGLIGLGDLLYRAATADPRRYQEARAPLLQYTLLEPKDPKGWSLLGRTYFHLGVMDSALTALTTAEKLGDTTKESFTDLGLVYADRKEWDQAVAALSKGDLGVREYSILGQIFEVTGRSEQADSVYRLILAQDSTSAVAGLAYGQRAKASFRAKDFPGALDLFQRAIAIQPARGEYYFYEGLCLKELNRAPEALTALQKAATIDSTQADRFFWLGVVEDGLKQVDDAQRAFQRSIDLAPTGPTAATAYRQLGYYQLLDKKWTAATPLLEKAVSLAPNDEQAWLWLAQGHQNAGNRTKAAECYRKVLSLDPKNSEALKGLKSLGPAAKK